MKRILVVDDDAGVREALGAIFEDISEYTTQFASDGLSGLDAVKQDPPDLVILDVRMPGLDGLTLLKRIRAFDTSIPVLILTAHAENYAAEALKYGAAACLAKPFDLNDLESCVTATLEIRRHEPQAQDSSTTTTGDRTLPAL